MSDERITGIGGVNIKAMTIIKDFENFKKDIDKLSDKEKQELLDFATREIEEWNKFIKLLK